MTFAERDELAMELWKEGENYVLRRDWPGARKARLRENAPAYAMVRCGIGRMQDTPETPEFLTALVDWYFSGNWIRREGDPHDS